MGLLIEVLGAYSDIIIDDAPPITAVTDAIILASKVDSVLLVARYGHAKRDEIRKAKAALMTVDASVLGYVMNDFPRPKAERYNTYYGSTD